MVRAREPHGDHVHWFSVRNCACLEISCAQLDDCQPVPVPACSGQAQVAVWCWAEFVPFLAFELEVRRVIFSTNAIESLNARVRREVRARGYFPNDQ